MAPVRISNFDSYRSQQQDLTNKIKKFDLNTITCPECGSKFFEQIKVGKFQSNHQVIYGQEIPPISNSVPYILLKCVYCRRMLEPNIISTVRDPVGGIYNELLDTLEGKKDIRKTEEEKKQKNIDVEEI